MKARNATHALARRTKNTQVDRQARELATFLNVVQGVDSSIEEGVGLSLNRGEVRVLRDALRSSVWRASGAPDFLTSLANNFIRNLPRKVLEAVVWYARTHPRGLFAEDYERLTFGQKTNLRRAIPLGFVHRTDERVVLTEEGVAVAMLLRDIL